VITPRGEDYTAHKHLQRCFTPATLKPRRHPGKDSKHPTGELSRAHGVEAPTGTWCKSWPTACARLYYSVVHVAGLHLDVCQKCYFPLSRLIKPHKAIVSQHDQRHLLRIRSSPLHLRCNGQVSVSHSMHLLTKSGSHSQCHHTTLSAQMAGSP
jgi:hypothetical protein